MPDILFEVGHRVGTTRLNRSDWLNAISGPMPASLTVNLIEYDQSRDPRVVVPTGAGRGYCAGLDLKDAASRSDRVGDLGAEDNERPGLANRVVANDALEAEVACGVDESLSRAPRAMAAPSAACGWVWTRRSRRIVITSWRS